MGVGGQSPDQPQFARRATGAGHNLAPWRERWGHLAVGGWKSSRVVTSNPATPRLRVYCSGLGARGSGLGARDILQFWGWLHPRGVTPWGAVENRVEDASAVSRWGDLVLLT